MNKSESVTDDLNKYINASWINSATKERAFIAAQAPNVNMIPAFWQMIIEQKVSLIVMICRTQ
jgi:protein tyrosine phosphatase